MPVRLTGMVSGMDTDTLIQQLVAAKQTKIDDVRGKKTKLEWQKEAWADMNKKIYSLRFSTDCFSDYFNDLGRKTMVGLDDYFEYAGERATVDELKMQNSFFINSLYPDNNT